MDIAKNFKPETILLWQKVADQPEARRIVNMFPSANINMIEHQRLPESDMSPSQALLAGKRTLMIGHASSFVGNFDGTLGSNICCHPYYKLVPVSNGCPYYCTYCYLAYVYRKFSPFIKININYDTMFKQIRKTLAQSAPIASFNMGEMLDSLALDHITTLTTELIPFFSGLSKGCLMLLTKSSNIDNLLKLEPDPKIIVSWSLNCEQIIKQYEKGTASLNERIEAARKCQSKGYRIRLRIDPGIYYPAWQTGYSELIEKMLSVIEPENITLGMLRFLPGHFQLAKNAYGKNAVNLLTNDFIKGASDGKLRYPPELRIKFYRFLIDTIRCFNKNVSISLCRETPDIWNIFKDHCDNKKCNCLIW
jgi:spore photoproduct lyase